MKTNRQEFNDLKHLKQFIELYKQCKDINKLSKIDNEEKSVFKLKTNGLPVRFGCTKKLLDYIPEREGLYNFWQDNKYFWIIPLEISPNEVYGFMVRGYEKSYNVFRLTSDLPVIFGLYDFENFKFGDQPVILTEGVKDALVLKTIYPYSLSLNTSGLTVNSLQFVKGLTNNFILIYDNDNAGHEAIKRDKESLKELGCKVIDILPIFKDVGKYIDHPNQLEILNLTIKQYL